MKIWIIGKQSGLINVIRRRLQKEGHEVHANISEKKILKYIDTKNVNYNFGSTSQITKKAFDDFNPDMVIYTGYYDETFRENKQSSEHLTELVNILNLCIDSSVNRFVYLSSYEIYENIDGGLGCTETMDLKPESIRGYRLLEAEALVKRWSEFTKKISIILRTAPIYGEISTESWNNFNNLNALVDIKNNKDVSIPFSVSNPVHIYDLTDAIVKSFNLVTDCIYNVAGNEIFTNQTFGDVLKEVIAKDSESQFDVKEELRIVLDTKRLKNDLEWAPKYNCFEGMHASIENNKKDISNSIKKRKDDNTVEEKKPFYKRQLFNRILLMLEVPLIFLIVVVVIFVFNRNMHIFAFVDIFIVYIVIVSSIHSIAKSIFAPIFSSIYLIGLNFFDGYDLVNSLFNVTNIIIIIQYFLIWSIISYTLDYYRELVVSKNDKIRRMNKDINDIELLNNMNTNIKNQLLSNMAGYKDSLGKLYSVIDQLDSANPEEIYEKLPYVLQQIMNCRYISLYTVSGRKYLRLHISTCHDGRSFGNTVNLEEYPELLKMFVQNEIYTNMDLVPNMPMMAAPIISEGKAIAAIFLWNMPLNETTTYFKNKLKTLALLISKNLERANDYLEAEHSERFLEDTEILKKEAYLKVLAQVNGFKEKDMADFLLLKIKQAGDIKELSLNLTKLLRNTDYAGINKNGDVECILANTTVEFSELIIKRFLDAGIECEVIL